MTNAASIVHDIFNAIDAREDVSAVITAEVEALSSYDVCHAGMDGHEECEADDPCCGMEGWPSLRDVGAVVVTWLRDNIAEHVTHRVLEILILDLLDLDNVAIIEEIGRTWYPGDAYRAARLAGMLS